MGGIGSGPKKLRGRMALASSEAIEALGVAPSGRMTAGVEADVLAGRVPFGGRAVAVSSRSAAVLALRAAGFTTKEIGEHLGIKEATARQMLYLLRKKGRLSETEDQLDHGIVPRAVEQLNNLVDAGDKDAILAVLRGRGQLKTHTAGGAGAGAAAVVTNLVVSFQVPEGKEKPVLVGQVVGVPRERGED